eukprot:139411-Rhodomonas_salina.4
MGSLVLSSRMAVPARRAPRTSSLTAARSSPLSAYAHATRYPVLTSRMVISACYAMSGTDGADSAM